MTSKEKSKKIIKNAEYGVDSRYASDEERAIDGKKLMEARKQRMADVSNYQIVKAKLLQLKYRMEEFLKEPVSIQSDFFIEFLKSYIDSIYTKRVHFAKDISISPVLLSQVLNKHKTPTDEFILKLMIHSEKTYEKVGKFHKETWYQVYFHEKICDTMATQDEWRPEVEKQVTIDHLKG